MVPYAGAGSSSASVWLERVQQIDDLLLGLCGHVELISDSMGSIFSLQRLASGIGAGNATMDHACQIGKVIGSAS